MMFRRGYMFTLDMLVAIIILIIGFFLMLGWFTYAPDKERTSALTDDVIGILSHVRLDEICDFESGCSCPYQSLDSLCAQIGQDPSLSILEFIGRLYHEGKMDHIESVIADLIDDPVLPSNFGLQLRLIDPSSPENEVQIYPKVVIG